MLSRAAYILCTVAILYVSLIYLPKWKAKGTESSLGWDAATYYWYLPATFIYQDLKEQQFGDSIIKKYGFTPEFSQSFVHSSGNRVIVYSSGIALLSVPAFIFAHAVASPLGYEADGFSLPYQVAVQLWAVMGGLFGLWYFRKLLLLYFSDKVTAVLLLMLIFGTNYFNYAAYDATITHSWLFTIYALLLLHIHHFYKAPGRKNAIAIGLLTGLAILVRPSEMVAILLPLLWGMEGFSRKAINKHVAFLKANVKYIGSALLSGLLVCSIQVVYWLYVTGSPFVYSYDDKTFSWLAPHIQQYLTSYRNGWLMYNPMVIFIFIGIIPFIKYGRNRVAILSFFLLNLYVISAWDIWWYSGIGGRAMIQSYAVIFIIAGYCVDYILKRKWLTYIALPFFLLAVYINAWVFFQAHASGGLYNTSNMSGKYYWSVIGRWNVDKEVLKLQDAADIYTGALNNRQVVYTNDFAEITGGVLHIPSGNNSEIFTVPYTGYNKEWVRVEAVYKGNYREYDEWNMLRTRIHFMNGSWEVKGEDWKPQRFLDGGVPQKVHYDIKTPALPFDRIELSFLNETGEQDIIIDDLVVTSYNSTGN